MALGDQVRSRDLPVDAVMTTNRRKSGGDLLRDHADHSVCAAPRSVGDKSGGNAAKSPDPTVNNINTIVPALVVTTAGIHEAEAVKPKFTHVLPFGDYSMGNRCDDSDVAKAAVVRNQVPRGIFTDFLRREVSARAGFRSLPMSMLLLFGFVGSVVYHERAAERQAVSEAVVSDILGEGDEYGQGFWENIIVPGDVWRWLKNVIVPRVSDNYLQYNKVIGGVRLMVQSRPEDISYCHAPGSESVSESAQILRMRCMQVGRVADKEEYGIDQLAFNPRGQETTEWSAGPTFDAQADKIDYRWLMLSKNETEHAEQVESLEAAGWINRHVRQMQVSYVLFNADYNVYVLVEANIFFSRSGRLWTQLRINTVVSVYDALLPILVFDLIFLGMLIYSFVHDAHTVFLTWMQVPFHMMDDSLPHHIVWYVLDVIGLVCGVALAVTNSLMMSDLDAIVQKLADGYPAMRSNEKLLGEFVSDMEHLIYNTSENYYSTVWIYPINLMVRLLMAFHTQPRLSIVSTTLFLASKDLAHYGFIFLSLMFVFTALAMTLFGRQLEGFSSFTRSMHSCSRILFGDVDWDGMKEIGFYRAAFFYWLFHFVMVMVMFNILLAIILDAYEDARKVIGSDSATLWKQTVATCRRWKLDWQGQKKVSLSQLKDACLLGFGETCFTDDQPLSSQDLVDLVKNSGHELSLEDAEHLLYLSMVYFQTRCKPDIDSEDIMGAITALQDGSAAFEQEQPAQNSVVAPVVSEPPRAPPALVQESSAPSTVADALELARALASDKSEVLQHAIEVARHLALQEASLQRRTSRDLSNGAMAAERNGFPGGSAGQVLPAVPGHQQQARSRGMFGSCCGPVVATPSSTAMPST